MKATYDPNSRTYNVTGMSAKVAHVLIWGGYLDHIRDAQELLRQALVDAEDTQMPDDHYLECGFPLQTHDEVE